MTSEELDRLSDTSTGIGVGKTREEYLRSFARPCASPQFTARPYSSPTSGFYDAMNTSTSLILLNKRFKNSHLRESTLIEEFSNVSENFAENESITELNRTKPRQKSKSPRRSIDPHRHFDSIGQNKYWHNRRCNSSCFNENAKKINEQQRTSRLSSTSVLSRRSIQQHRPSIRLQPESSHIEYQIDSTTFTKSFYPSTRDLPEKFKQSEFDLRVTPAKIKSKVPLTETQQLYLLSKARIYDTKPTKIRRNHSFNQVFADRLKTDIQCKPQFRLNDPNSLAKYANFFRSTRRITTSSFSIRSNDLSKIESSMNEEKSTIVVPRPTIKQIRPTMIQI